MGLNLSPLATGTGLRPQLDILGETFQDKTSRNQYSIGTFTKMRYVVNCVKNRPSHLLQNQGVEDTCGRVTEKIEARRRNRDHRQGETQPWGRTVDTAGFGKNQRAVQGRNSMADLMLWIRGKETLGGNYIWVLGQKITELLRGREKGCVEI